MKTKAVIFDMDGLLIDSEPIWSTVESKIFSTVTKTTITPLMTKQTMGRRVDESVDYWYEQFPWEKPSKKEVEAQIVKGVIEKVRTEGKALPGVYAMIKLCNELGLPMGIASSSYMELIQTVVDTLGIRNDMKVLHSAEHEPFGKPHPGVYLSAAQSLQITPEKCLVFEDSPAGILAAKSARMMCIAVPNEHAKGDKIFIIADKVLRSLADFSKNDIL